MSSPSIDLLVPTFRSLGLTVLRDHERLLVSAPNATTTEIAFSGPYVGLEWRSAGIPLDRQVIDLTEPGAAVAIKEFVLDRARRSVTRGAA
jgi:hypothetical protein